MSTHLSPSRWLERSILLAVVLAAAVAISPNVADPDLWGHVQYGRDALREGLATTTTYSYTADGYRWINHENLAELFLAVGIDLVGPIGMLIVKCLLGAGVVALIIRSALRRDVTWLVAGSAGLLVATNLAYHWSLRPQLLSYLYYAAMLVVVSYSFEGWEGAWRLGPPAGAVRRSFFCGWATAGTRVGEDYHGYSSRRLRFLWFVPVIMLFWANSHGGFVAGFCIFAAYMFCRSLEAVAMYGRGAWPLLLRFGMMVLATALATFINPYGPGLHAWLHYALSMPRPEIVEWHPPDLLNPLTIPLWLMIGTWALALTFTRRSRDFTHLILMTVTLWQSLEHQRHIPFFAIAFGLWMPVHIDSVVRRCLSGTSQDVRGSTATTYALRGAFVLALVGVYGLLGVRLYDRLNDMPVRKDVYPVSAFQYIADQNVTGRLVVTMNWAQYVLGAFAPEERTMLGQEPDGILVGFDGRFRTCYPQEVIDMHFDFVLGDMPMMRYRSPNSPPFDRDRVLEYGNPDLVLLNRFQPHSACVMRMQQGRWVMLYQDAVAELWGRSDKYARVESPFYIAPSDRRISDEPQVGSVTWPAFPVARPRPQYADRHQHETAPASPAVALPAGRRADA